MEGFIVYLVHLLLHIVFFIVIQISLRQAVIIAGHKTSKSREGGTTGLTSEVLQSNSRIFASVKSESCLHNFKDLHTQMAILVICSQVAKHSSTMFKSCDCHFLYYRNQKCILMPKLIVMVTLIIVQFRCVSSASTSQAAQRAANWLFNNVHSSVMILCRECHFLYYENVFEC